MTNDRETRYRLGMNHDYLVYALCEPDAPTNVRYIGKATKGVADRLKGHRRSMKSKAHYHIYRWWAKLLREGKEPVVRILESGFTSEAELFLMEKGLIAQYKMLGYDLANMTDGGEGMSNPSPEIRAKISEAQKGNTTWRGRTHTEETKKLMAEKQTGRVHSPEHREKNRVARLGKPAVLTPEGRESKRRKMIGNKNCPVGFKHSKEEREAKSLRQKGKKRSESGRAGLRAGWVKRRERMGLPPKKVRVRRVFRILDSDGIEYKNMKEACETLGISQKFVRRSIKDGRVHPRLGKSFSKLPNQQS